MSISTARMRRECEAGTFCHEMAYEVCRERDELKASLAEQSAELATEKREHLATQELHERSMRMIEDAIGPDRDKFDGWHAEVSAKAIAAIATELAELRAKLAKYDDATLVDKEWLQQNGFTYHTGLGTWRRELPSLRVLEVNLAPYDPGVYFAQDKPGAPVHVVRATKEIPTRDQLRHLIDGLGVRA